MALGAAKMLFQHRGELPFTVKFIFQPYEEGGGGAKAMIADGVLADPKVDAVVATGAKMFHFGDKADMWQLLNTLPKDVIVMGNISPSAVFMCDSTYKMAHDTQTLLRQCLGFDNFMISSGCDIPADTPLENIDKFFEVIRLGYHKAVLWGKVSHLYQIPEV